MASDRPHADVGVSHCPPGSLKSKVSAHPRTNWVDKQGGLPRYIERIACHIHFDHGMPIDIAIASAVNDCKRMCSTGESNFGHVHAGPQAEACEAVAHWEAMKAASHAESGARAASRG